MTFNRLLLLYLHYAGDNMSSSILKYCLDGSQTEYASGEFHMTQKEIEKTLNDDELALLDRKQSAEYLLNHAEEIKDYQLPIDGCLPKYYPMKCSAATEIIAQVNGKEF